LFRKQNELSLFPPIQDFFLYLRNGDRNNHKEIVGYDCVVINVPEIKTDGKTGFKVVTHYIEKEEIHDITQSPSISILFLEDF
jgi:hypothetical protein